MTRKIEDLAKISLKKKPVMVDVEENSDHSTVSGLTQVSNSNNALAIKSNFVFS